MNIKNNVQLIGRLGGEPQVITLNSGSKLAKFSLAITESYKSKKGEKVSDTQWHSIVAWGNLAVLAEKMLHKGSQVTIDGKLINRSFTDKDGIKRSSTQIVANEFFLINTPKAA